MTRNRNGAQIQIQQRFFFKGHANNFLSINFRIRIDNFVDFSSQKEYPEKPYNYTLEKNNAYI